MITLTDAAYQHLSKILEEQRKSRRVLRLSSTPEGLALVSGELRREDEVLEYGGAPLLAFDREVAASLVGQTLDVESKAGRPSLTLR